ncbi:MAG: threonine/serine exporter family protein [Peptostreptococcaceae bacterium]
MIELPFYIHIIFSFLAALGFAMYLKCPKATVIQSAAVGTVGWIVYVVLMRFGSENTFANFTAAGVVSILSEILARKLKQPKTSLVIPGIIPLIPGLGLYDTLYYLGQKDFLLAIEIGTNTIFASSSIALGVLVISSLIKTINIIEYKQKLKLKNKLK